MILFAKSNVCKNKKHCQTCRDKEGGRQWRESLRVAFKLPGDETDFECPHGLPWGCGPQTKAQKKHQAQQDENAELAKERFNICKQCDDSSDGGFKCKHHKTCCFGKWRAKPESKCPIGKW